MATKKTWNKDGEKQEKTSWHRIVVFGKQAENCEQYLDKGQQVFIEGEIDYQEYDDKDGNKKYATNIIAENVQFLSSGNDNGGSSND